MKRKKKKKNVVVFLLVQLNGGRWTDEEHQGFLSGLEVYGHGNWNAIAVFVPTRSPPQIEAYARQYFALGEAVQNLQQVDEQQQQRQVWSRAGLVPDLNDPDGEEALRRHLATIGICYGML
ncbi:MYB [Ectocarpus sp. CCAP 1310/34]|nr:MYB [Ectocarpus sp. CCAP 1310/34]